jgi:ABC-type xylose transport system permease subunit
MDERGSGLMLKELFLVLALVNVVVFIWMMLRKRRTRSQNDGDESPLTFSDKVKAILLYVSALALWPSYAAFFAVKSFSLIDTEKYAKHYLLIALAVLVAFLALATLVFSGYSVN